MNGNKWIEGRVMKEVIYYVKMICKLSGFLSYGFGFKFLQWDNDIFDEKKVVFIFLINIGIQNI